MSEVVDTVTVKSLNGGTSRCTLKTYDQQRKRWQGTSRHVIWGDEECGMDLYTEMITRVMDVDGIVMMTFTPMLGQSEVVNHFLEQSE